MKQIYTLIVILLLVLLLPIPSYAISPSGQGIFIVTNCSNITNPVTNGTWCLNATTGTQSFWNGTAWIQPIFNTVHFANLGAPSNGAQIYCDDCTQTTTCQGAGTGAMAMRVGGAWTCGTGPPQIQHPMLAHYHMAFNVSGTTVAAYKNDILDAQALGYTGFVMNAGAWVNNISGTYKANALNMYTAAQQLGTGFKIIMNPDVAAKGWLTDSDIEDMVATACAQSANMTYLGKCVFGGWGVQNYPYPNSCANGTSGGGCPAGPGNTISNNNAASWRNTLFSSNYNSACTGSAAPYACCTGSGTGTCTTPGSANIFWVPAIEGGSSNSGGTGSGVEIPSLAQVQTTVASWSPYVDGMWHGGGEIWAVPDAVSSPNKLTTDQNWTTGINAGTCFYGGKCINEAEPVTHAWETAGSPRYEEYYGGTGIANQWMQYINTTKPDWMEDMSWQDFGESWLTPYTAYSGSPNYVGTGNPQGGMDALAAYYRKWYVTGSQPPINTDQVFYSYRRMPSTGTCTGVQSGTQNGAVVDDIYITVILTAPATLAVNSGGNITNNSPGAGITTYAIPFTVGTTQTFTLTRSATTLVSLTGPAIVANNSSSACDFSPVTGVGYSNGYVYPPYVAGGLTTAP